jgi:hypothetical protein
MKTNQLENSKFEIRKRIQNEAIEKNQNDKGVILEFEFWISYLFRISGLEFRISFPKRSKQNLEIYS